eukprot:m.134809 g.134809  ORF g.134809 m.134809 type:complete len:50 (+) comp29758_c0_seq3:1034-1183(+)
MALIVDKVSRAHEESKICSSTAKEPIVKRVNHVETTTQLRCGIECYVPG